MFVQKKIPSKAVRLVIQAGLVPKEVVQQLARWGLFPEGSIESTGKAGVETQWETVEEFVEDLSFALSKEASEIRETELNYSGGFRECYLEFKKESEYLNETGQVFIDKLGRAIVPSTKFWCAVEYITFEGESFRREIVSRGARYEGLNTVALVYCLSNPMAKYHLLTMEDNDEPRTA